MVLTFNAFNKQSTVRKENIWLSNIEFELVKLYFQAGLW